MNTLRSSISPIKIISKNIIYTMLLILLTSCGVARNIKLPALSSSDILIKSYIENSNILALINSSSSFPEQYEFISHYLINTDYSMCSYDDLLSYESRSVGDSTLFTFFHNLREEYEEIIMDSLSTLSVSDIAYYYKKHPEEAIYLNPYLEESIYPTLNQSDYYYLRELHNAFDETYLSAAIDSVWAERRAELLPVVMKNIDEYFSVEQSVINVYKDHTWRVLDSLLRTNLPLVIDKTLNVSNEGVLNLLFVEIKYDKTPLNDKIQEFSDSLFNPQLIQNILQKEVNNLRTELNTGRELLHYNLLYKTDSSFPVSTSSEIIEPHLPRIPRSDLDKIDEYTKNSIKSRNISSLISTAIGFIPGGWIVKGADVVMSVGDMAYCIISDTKEGRTIQEYVSYFSEKYYNTMYDYINHIVDSVFDSQQNTLNNDQSIIKDIINETF